MKKIISLIIVLSLLVTGCTQVVQPSPNPTAVPGIEETFLDLSDDQLIKYTEDTIYSDLVSSLNNDGYFVENVSAVYLSKEYIEELEYNSQENIYFGLTETQLLDAFGETIYNFSVNENGETIVVETETTRDIYNTMIRNVAIGAGVIVICVVVSVATHGAAPAVSMIFAASAKTATKFALGGAALGGISKGIVTYIETGDWDKSLEEAGLAASEGFMWGAISGAVVGGTKETIVLKGATLNGLTMNEAARIQRESNWPIQAIKSFHSEAEYNIYKSANLDPLRLSDGSYILARDINWNLIDSAGRTNAQRVLDYGLAPIDSSGKPYDFHHIGMKADGPLAILKYDEHHSSANYKVLHWSENGKGLSNAEWLKIKKEKWSLFYKATQGFNR